MSVTTTPCTQVQEILASAWVGLRPYDEFVKAVAGGPQSLHTVNLSSFLNIELVSSTPQMQAAVYIWQIQVNSRDRALSWVNQQIEYVQSKLNAIPSPAFVEKEADEEDDEEEDEEEEEEQEYKEKKGNINEKSIKSWERKHLKQKILSYHNLHRIISSHHGGFHHYGGYSTDITQRYAQRAFSKHFASRLHAKMATLSATENPIFSFVFGLLARDSVVSSNLDVAMMMGVKLESSLGRVMAIDASSLFKFGRGDVLNSQMMGLAHGRYIKLISDRPLMLQLCKTYYTETGCGTHKWMASKLSEICDDRPVTIDGASKFIRKHLKPITEEAGVSAEYLTRCAGCVRAKGSPIITATLAAARTEQLRRCMIEGGWRIPIVGSQRKKRKLNREEMLNCVFRDELNGEQRTALLARMFKVAETKYIDRDHERERLLVLQDELDASTLFDRPFDAIVDAVHAGRAGGRDVYTCKYAATCLHTISNRLSNLHRHYKSVHCIENAAAPQMEEPELNDAMQL